MTTNQNIINNGIHAQTHTGHPKPAWMMATKQPYEEQQTPFNNNNKQY